MKNIDLYLAGIDNASDGIVALSLVKSPAMNSRLCVTRQTDSELEFVCPIIIANNPIFRNDKGLGDRYILFTDEEVASIMKKATIDKTIYRYDLEHNEEPIDGIVLVESFLIDYARGIKNYKGLVSLNDGSWIGKFLVTNKDLIAYINNRDIVGISISAYLTEEKVELSEIAKLYNFIKI